MLDEVAEIVIELKYCERCGGLWFREAGSNANLCDPCTVSEPWLAKRHEERRQKAAAERARFEPMPVLVERLQGISSEAGRRA